MRILKKYGLTSPRIETLKTSINNRGEFDYLISLVCSNSTAKPRIGKIFSFFEGVFADYIYKEIEEGLYSKFEAYMKEEGVINLDTDIKAELIIYIEENFENYLSENIKKLDEELKSLISSNAFPELLWRRAKSSTFIQIAEDDKESGYLLFCLIPESISEKKDGIPYDKEVQSIAENILYSEKIQAKSVSLYYKTLSESEFITAQISLAIKEKISEGYLVFTLVPTNSYTKSLFKKTVYLRATQFTNSN